jgi:integrase
MLIAEGVDLKTISALAGHSSIAFTLSTYGHLMPDHQDKARAALSRRFNAKTVGNVVAVDFGKKAS